MTTRFKARLQISDSAGVAVIAFTVQEGYNTGWGGTARVIGSVKSGTMNAGRVFTALMASGYYAGRRISLDLFTMATDDDDEETEQTTATTARRWPCVITNARPFEIDATYAGCDFDLLDPVSYFASQPVWGAYRHASPAEIIGGVISLAAGGAGKPNTSQALATLGKIEVKAAHRKEIDTIPYAIAAGEPMGEWLAEVLGLLGLRAELSLNDELDGVRLTLTDMRPSGTALTMNIIEENEFEDEPTDGAATAINSESEPSTTEDENDNEDTEDEEELPLSHGRIFIAAHAGFPGIPARGGLLDDPSIGSARVVYARGPIGYLINTPGIDTIEAARRVHQSIRGSGSEMLVLGAVSGQPAVKPGQLIEPDSKIHGIATWQTAGVLHAMGSERYYNEIRLLRGDRTWYPELPLYHGPRYVSATVDGGDDYNVHEPVPRDELGQIKVSFPFTPTPSGFEAQMIAIGDTNADGTVRLDDFDEKTEAAEYRKDKAKWDGEAKKLTDGEYDDPFEGRTDADLSAEELIKRQEATENRRKALRYMAYRELQVAKDLDHDGRITDRDTEISEELSKQLKSEAGRRRMRELAAEEDDEATEEEKDLLAEYQRLFETSRVDTSELSEETMKLRDKVAEEADKWPPRVALPVISPMAGARHGFITAHRQGDTCKVAVNNPLSAEIVGFQYRADRQINADVSGALGGMIVEHNYGNAWSGVIFRRKDEVVATEDGEESEDDV